MENKLDLRIERTYLSLNKAFTGLMEEKRFENITVNELCERAMIRRTTFYKHFADKHEYFAFYLKELCENFRRGLGECTQLRPELYFRHMCREMAVFLRGHEKLVKNVLDSNNCYMLLQSMSEMLMQDMMEELALHFGERLGAGQRNSLAAYCSGGVIGAYRLRLERKQSLDDDFIETVTDMICADINNAVDTWNR